MSLFHRRIAKVFTWFYFISPSHKLDVYSRKKFSRERCDKGKLAFVFSCLCVKTICCFQYKWPSDYQDQWEDISCQREIKWKLTCQSQPGVSIRSPAFSFEIFAPTCILHPQQSAIIPDCSWMRFKPMLHYENLRKLQKEISRFWWIFMKHIRGISKETLRLIRSNVNMT